MTESFFPQENEITPPPEPAPTPEPVAPKEEAPSDDLTDEGRLAAILSYIPFLCFVPLMNINWKENEEARFHARQGIVLFVIEMLAVIMLVDDVAKFVFRVLLIVAVSLAAAGIYFAVQGKRFRLPLISDIADKARL
jgi:uncharacterized membrane protein